MADYLRIRNWDRFQYRTKERLPWIRVYDALLEDYEYTRLTDAERGVLLDLWLVANRLNNKIPNDPSWIRRLTRSHRSSTGQVLSKLLQSGFLEDWPSANGVPANPEGESAEEAPSLRPSRAADLDRDLDREEPPPPPLKKGGRMTRAQRAKNEELKKRWSVFESLIKNTAHDYPDAALKDELTKRGATPDEIETLLQMARDIRDPKPEKPVDDIPF